MYMLYTYKPYVLYTYTFVCIYRPPPSFHPPASSSECPSHTGSLFDLAYWMSRASPIRQTSCVKWLCCPFNSILQEELTQGIWHKKLQFAYFPLLEVLAGYMRIIHRHTKGSLDLWYLYYWPLSILYMSASVLHFERVLSMLHLPYCW